ncbi:MAG: type I glyceraldehyde-3-phosphate dehydrogenase [Candidatus Colwellbacteria bacterium RIFCSPHIGHO2_12_FULL_43_12]|uniref:Type I glyceraldehyde-3-phosphate dehydrogenase n=3 Tax=Candidatus Colwelliibacteriota TaxID=1817904 RepID=A0A1G1YZR9_9BACT|nr:MAG: type I glyceraldehyde-3-phosphate dehydrogenase [Candidatus Colwellbacteria bacterium RIFCSPHIGHO2_02_FULL_43_15]OGY58765.1 MAG: type I glyceraldehyde-3-phosphate dehydrogenase [Candidatus Colwellbacteria bacterium RIFCSPHIGHO2_12_FULL_43_12]OGY61444.1 MAG: type I glyceraldehyde-3-phosphate dehydrogenase [Candidatus Colwellbacteria bacterium RIFCSPLOWO2_12_FULL_43_11]
MTKVAINGFGRIGRLFFRQAFGSKDIEIVAINDLGDLEDLAYLLKYDTVYGRYSKTVKTENGNFIVDGQVIKCVQIKDPSQLPWKELGVDVVVESTGVFESFESVKPHILAGAKRVVITAPAKDPDGTEGKTILVGVNPDEAKGVVLTSNGSCTTNAASPIIAVLNETIGIEKAVLNTVHGYTATQNLVDGPTKGSDFRRGRAAAQNIVPSTTGAAISVTRAVKGLDGKFDGIAIRVPVAAGSIADVTFLAKKKTTVEEVNSILKAAAESPRWKGILAVTEEQLVSSDIIGEPYGAIVDLKLTKVVDGDLVKVLSWYDNEWGYCSTLVKHIQNLAA